LPRQNICDVNYTARTWSEMEIRRGMTKVGSEPSSTYTSTTM
jgi:hypothetical protein